MTTFVDIIRNKREASAKFKQLNNAIGKQWWPKETYLLSERARKFLSDNEKDFPLSYDELKGLLKHQAKTGDMISLREYRKMIHGK